MRNIILWFIMMLVNFSCISFAYKKFGKIGLYIWVPISTILANIQVVMLVRLFGMDATLGNILYAGGFLITDILNENYGKQEAKIAVKIGFFSLISMAIIMQLAILFTPLDIPEGIKLFNGIRAIFSLMPRLVFASLSAYLISQFHDVWLYELIKSKLPSTKYLWFRNNGSTLISQILDNLIFTLIAFYGVYPFETLLQIFISTYIIKTIVAICDTPFIYLAEFLFRKKLIPDC
ncbi:MAG: queuosine precursor transporter [Fusobacterium sp.]|uniref:queuosine precursor transporter n=1 Tax=Fusobacterium sp. TaxID=68766 RepID=UPI0026DC75CB|nr:queuosine precursor transporter [Fusobacterium sp.]MDO4690807.1 queuosine precursor transporter [Fusobacterium sp.]